MLRRTRAGAARLLFAAAFAGAATAALAQDFPAGKKIEMTVMFGAGSAADVSARTLAQGLSKELATPVIAVNRPGNGGAAGYQHVAQQRPDGYSIIWNSNSISTNYHAGILPFDFHAFDPVARATVEIPVLTVRADAPWKTLKELLDHAKANPGKVRVGNSGVGSHTHLAASALFAAAEADEIEVPFGQAQAVVNLLAGRIDAAVQLPAAVVAHVKGGDLRVLAVLGSRRAPVFPDVPTAEELGYPVALDMWRGIAVPKGTPRAVISRLEDAARRTVESPAFESAGATVGFTPAFLPADKFGKLIASDDVRLGNVMAELGLKRR
jgi:tripartite-type tricarboxylate transporter receptor subunit TctC